MNSLPEVRIGIVGYGSMGRAHSFGYHAAPIMANVPIRPVLKVISGRNPGCRRGCCCRIRNRGVDHRLARTHRARRH